MTGEQVSVLIQSSAAQLGVRLCAEYCNERAGIASCIARGQRHQLPGGGATQCISAATRECDAEFTSLIDTLMNTLATGLDASSLARLAALAYRLVVPHSSGWIQVATTSTATQHSLFAAAGSLLASRLLPHVQSETSLEQLYAALGNAWRAEQPTATCTQPPQTQGSLIPSLVHTCVNIAGSRAGGLIESLLECELLSNASDTAMNSNKLSLALESGVMLHPLLPAGRVEEEPPGREGTVRVAGEVLGMPFSPVLQQLSLQQHAPQLRQAALSATVRRLGSLGSVDSDYQPCGQLIEISMRDEAAGVKVSHHLSTAFLHAIAVSASLAASGSLDAMVVAPTGSSNLYTEGDSSNISSQQQHTVATYLERAVAPTSPVKLVHVLTDLALFLHCLLKQDAVALVSLHDAPSLLQSAAQQVRQLELPRPILSKWVRKRETGTVPVPITAQAQAQAQGQAATVAFPTATRSDRLLDDLVRIGRWVIALANPTPASEMHAHAVTSLAFGVLAHVFGTLRGHPRALYPLLAEAWPTMIGALRACTETREGSAAIAGQVLHVLLKCVSVPTSSVDPACSGGSFLRSRVCSELLPVLCQPSVAHIPAARILLAQLCRPLVTPVSTTHGECEVGAGLVECVAAGLFQENATCAFLVDPHVASHSIRTAFK